jgi:SAM-dependent methyltransferase
MLHFCGMQQWFESWFDTKYYHQLYAKRDDAEAQLFIDKLFNLLKLKTGDNVLDNACGRGRHAKYLAKKGLDVLGLDLSKNSIDYAKTFENDHLHFEVHDMREIYKPLAFDAIFNLFTSFGYFDNPAEDKKIIDSIYQQLKPNGIFVLDFFNADMVQILVSQNLAPISLEIEGVRYHTFKKIENGHVIKTIKVEDGGNDFAFEERVKLWSKPALQKLLETSGFKVISVFGSYELQDYTKESNRCIFLCKK